MSEYHYHLWIVAPDDIDADTQAEIDDYSDRQDDTPEKRVARYLGGHINDAEQAIRAAMPDGWRAWIEESVGGR